MCVCEYLDIKIDEAVQLIFLSNIVSYIDSMIYKIKLDT